MADLIYVDPVSKGAIYQGGKADVQAIETDGFHYDLVILASRSYQPKHLFTTNPPQLLNIPFDDATNLSRGDKATIRKYVGEASLIVASFIQLGKRVLISCNAGRNRSGLITAFSLLRLSPELAIRPELAIKLIQKRRKDSLTNLDFVDLILEGLPSLPSI